MKALLFSTALSASLLAASGARAQDAGAFHKWFTRESPECVPISEFKSVSRLIELTPEQFQFVRALYVATPPISRTLPPGDRAVMAIAKSAVMLALVADDQACARFLAPDFVLQMLIQVGEGKAGQVGQPVSLRSSLN